MFLLPFVKTPATPGVSPLRLPFPIGFLPYSMRHQSEIFIEANLQIVGGAA
jgi:hypothetical protein